ncbi:MAG: acetylornithine deacetylase [Rhodospirillaceae bacterium]|jgi:acetylornithine deacetylase|nr:acetylornithine deacetylase [Rhodospirillaceae bacterium]MBT7266955.1 acetylornithine deacetylase [Rhodospirillaceae bacterium]
MAKHLTSEELLRSLISFATVSAYSNKELIAFVQDYLAEFGIICNIAPNEDGTKADLIATIGPMAPGGIVLSGHTDVVPVEGQDWHSDPFEMIEKDGKLYGRGACDMKGFIAVALALVPEFLARDLKVPLHLVFSYDEEVGCLGAPGLIARMCKDIPMPKAAIIGEPTSMKLVNAHKGVALFETTVTGRPGHSSQTHMGVNAISYAAACIHHIGEIAEELKVSGAIDARFEPPHSTISPGTIEGGTALNIIAEECKFVWDCRSISGEDGLTALSKFEAYCAENLIPKMREIAPEANIQTITQVSTPPLVAADDNPAEALVRQLTGQNQAGVVAFAAEAGLFQEAGVPSVICGPGSIDQAHRPDEYVEISQLKECEDFLRKLANWAAE